MRDAIKAGSILIETAAVVLDSWLPQGQPFSSGWISVGKRDRSALESGIHQAGGTFFYLAEEIRATVFGFDRQKTVRDAVRRLSANVKARGLNCLEITQVAMSSFLRVPYVTVVVHARHIQEGLVLRHRRSESTEEPLFAAEALTAWEDEGGAPGHIGGRRAA